MKFIHFPFDAKQGDTIEVTIDRAANVQFLDPTDYEQYRESRGYYEDVGYSTQSLFQKAPSCPKMGTGSEPARCLSPFSGRWRWNWGQAPAEDVRSQSPFPHAGTSGTDSKSPVSFDVPRDGTWHVVVDLGSRAGSVSASARLLREAAV